ncbi:MAG: ATP-grasp domain-containing protein [Sphaerotilus sp.]|nr:ATP-grasp domain-containing protein [Sphaerotilus sp.]
MPVIVIGEYEFPPSGYSRHCIEYICARNFTRCPENLLRVLRELRVRHGQALPVFPTADTDLRALVALHADLVGTALWVSAAPDTVNRMMDKRRFAAMAQALRLPVPSTHAPCTLQEVEALSRVVDFPVVLKPAHPTAWKRPGLDPAIARAKALVIDAPDELMRVCCRIAPYGLDVVVQDYVPGADDLHYSVHAWIGRSGAIERVVTTRKWRTFPIQVGTGCYVETVSVPDLEAEATDILAQLRLRGMVVMNFKRDVRTGQFMLLEVNPRLSCNSLLLTRAGFNLPWLVYNEVCGRQTVAPALADWRVGMRYLSAKADFLAFRALAREGRMGWGEYLRSVLRPGMVYRALDLSDMGPPVQMAADWLALKCKGSGRWVRSRLGLNII